MKIQLKRSVVLEDYGQGDEAKRPEAVQMLDGELAVNYNANDPAIFLKNSAGAIIRIAGSGSIGDDLFVEKAGDTMSGTLTINHRTANENALVTGAGHDIVLGAGANIVFDNTQDTTVQANSAAAAAVVATLPATTGTLTIEPTSNGVYLRRLNNGTLSWVLVSDDTNGVVTSVGAGDGINVDNTDPNIPEISVDLASNRGLEIESDKLAVIDGSNPQDTLLWTVQNGARELVESNGQVVVSGNTSQPQGRYVGVATSAATGSGCTINFDVDSSGVITNLTIANPGSGYGESEVLTIDGHQTAPPTPADITFTLKTDANNGRYTYTGWRTGALTTAAGGGSGGDLTGIDGGPGIEIDESDTTTPKVSIDLTTNSGLEFDTTGDAGQLQVNSGPGIEVVSAGVSTRIHAGGALSDGLGGSNNELGLAYPGTPSTSNQVVVWKALNSAKTITLAADPNDESSLPEADYINVPTTLVTSDSSATGSGLTVNFSVAADGSIVSGSLEISNPGSNYSETQPVCSVNNHGNLRVIISAKYTTAQWIAEPFTGGGGGGGDVTGVDAGDGIDVSTGGGPEPVVSVDVHANGGLTNRFDTAAAANAGELGIVPGSDNNDRIAWRESGSAQTISVANASDQGDASYVAVATTAT